MDNNSRNGAGAAERSLNSVWYAAGPALLLALMAALLLVAPARAQQSPHALSPAATTATTGTLTLGLFAPFSGSVPATAVNVAIDGAPILTGVVYGQIAADLPVEAGTRLVEVFAGASITPALGFTVEVQAGQHVEGAIFGGANGWPLQARQTPPLGGQPGASLTVRHLAPLAAGSSANVDICTEQSAPVPFMTLPFGTITRFEGLSPGAYDLHVAAAGSNCATVLLDLPPFRLHEDSAATLTIIGAGTAPFPVKTLTDGLSARLTVAHLASFADTLAGTSVSVQLSGTTVLTDFVFGEVAGPLDLPGLGNYPVAVFPTGVLTPAITGSVVVTGFVDYTAVAIGGAHQPLGLRVLGDISTEPLLSPATPATAPDLSAPDAVTNTVRLRLGHFAGTANAIADTAVEVCRAPANTLIIPDFRYSDVRTFNVEPGFVQLFLAQPGSSCAVTLVSGLSALASSGDEVTLLVGGDDVNQPVRAVTAPAVEVKRASLPLVRKQVPPPLVPLPDLLLLQGYETLNDLLVAADLDDDLRRPSPYTFFAPTDAAFAALPPGMLAALEADPTGRLAQALKFHVVAGRYTMDKLSEGTVLRTLEGGTLSFTYDSQLRLRVNGQAVVTPPGTVAANGILFSLDRVLLLPD